MTKAQEASLIVSMARAMFDDMNWPAYDYDHANPAIQEYTRKAALAALRAMKQHGPTEAMLRAVDCGGEKRMWNSGRAWIGGYAAMLQAEIEESQP